MYLSISLGEINPLRYGIPSNPSAVTVLAETWVVVFKLLIKRPGCFHWPAPRPSHQRGAGCHYRQSARVGIYYSGLHGT